MAKYILANNYPSNKPEKVGGSKSKAIAKKMGKKDWYTESFKTKSEHDKALAKHYMKTAPVIEHKGIMVHEKNKKSYRV